MISCVLLLAAVHCLAVVDRLMLAAVAPALRITLRLDDAQLGWLLGPAFAFAYAPAALLFGRMADHVGPVRLMVGGVLLWSVAGVGAGLAGSADALAAARMAMGVGQAAFVPAALAWLGGAAPAGPRPRDLSWFSAGSTTGRSLSLLIAGALLGVLGAAALPVEPWRALLMIAVLPNLLLLPLVARLPARALARPPAILPWLRGAARDLAPFVALALTPLILIQMTAAWLPELLVRARGLDPASAAMLAGLCTLAGAPVGHLLGGRLLAARPHWRAHLPAVIAGGVLASLPGLALVCWGPGLVAVALGLTTMNLALGAGSFAALFGVQAYAPAGLRGVISGFYMALVTLVALGSGPMAAGLLSRARGGDAAALASALALTAAVVAGLALLLLALQPRRGRRMTAAC